MEGVPKLLESSNVESSMCPVPIVNMTCICKNEMGTFSGSSRSSLKTSWKWVAARTLGQFGPRARRCLSTPHNSPAPSVQQAAEETDVGAKQE